MVTKRTNVTSICSKMILKIHSQDSSEFPIPLLEWRKLYYWQPKKKKVKWVQPYISPLFKFSIKLFG